MCVRTVPVVLLGLVHLASFDPLSVSHFRHQKIGTQYTAAQCRPGILSWPMPVVFTKLGELARLMLRVLVGD
jgi:hypothetical protein